MARDGAPHAEPEGPARGRCGAEPRRHPERRSDRAADARLNDAPEQLEPLLEAAIAAGAKSIGGVALHLRGEVRDLFMQWLGDQRPELLDSYEELYRRGAYASSEERKRLTGLVRDGTAGRLTPRDREASKRTGERPDAADGSAPGAPVRPEPLRGEQRPRTDATGLRTEARRVPQEQLF